MPVCDQCGQDNPDVAKFCLACGSPLAVAEPPAVAEERKLITPAMRSPTEIPLVGRDAELEQLAGFAKVPAEVLSELKTIETGL